MKRLMLVTFAMAAAAMFAADVKPETKAPDANLATSDTELEVTNLSTKPWPEMEIYLNEVPGGFKYRCPAPAVGAKVRIQLVRFVDKKGLRYNPATHGLKSVWIGGSGRDFVAFSVN